MPRTTFEIQRDADKPGLWLDILALIETEKAPLVAANENLTAERDAAIAKCDALVRKLSDPTATKEDVRAEAEKEQKTREIEELTKQRDAAAQQVADIEAKIQELGK